MRELTSALTLVALSLVTGCKSRDEAAAPSTSTASGSGPAAIKTVRPVKAALLRWVEQPGAVQPEEQTHLYARIPGFVERLHADTGTEVKKAGQVLAELAVPELVKEEKQKEALVHQADQELTLANRSKLSAVAELQAAKALVDEARAGEKRAQALNDRWQSEAARVNELVKRGVIDEQTRDETLNQAKAAAAALEEARARIQAASRRAEKTKTDVERAEADIAVARARAEVARADLARLRALLEFAKIRAPYAGFITRRQADTGALVQPSGPSARPLFTIVRLHRVRVVAAVNEADAVLVRDQAEAMIEIPALRKQWPGKVSRTSWAVEPGPRTLRVEIDLENEQQLLRPGMYAFVRIKVQQLPAFTLPVSAVPRQGDARVCFRVENGKALQMQVHVGHSDGKFIEVFRKQHAGSTEWLPFTGDEVVVLDAARVSDGQEIREEQ